MRTQEILTRVNEAIALFGDKNISSPCLAMQSLARDLEAQLRSEIANSKGVGNAVKTIVSILKGAEKDKRYALAYPWIDGEGRQCVCNGFVAFRLRNHLPLPERPKDAGDPIDLDRIIPDDLSGYKPLPMPSAKELREFIAIERAKHTGRRRIDPVWDFGEHKPAVNACYLLHAATVFPNAAELFWASITKPLILTCADGEAVVCPIRVQGKTASEEEQKAEAERRETIRKAHEDHNAWQEKAGEAQLAKNAALIEAEKATDEAAKDRAMQEYYTHAEAEGHARLQSYAAIMSVNPDYDITPDEFEYLIRMIHVREYAPHNAA